MLKKNSRNVRMLGLDLTYAAHGRTVQTRPDMRECLSLLQNKLLALGVLTETYSSERICVGLRKITFSANEKTATLLWAGGDSETVDPSFWNPQSDSTRSEPAVGGERVSFSCHMVIHLVPTPQLTHIAAKEEVPLLANGLIQRVFSSLLKKYAFCSLRADDTEKSFKAYPDIKIDTLASKTIIDALLGKKPVQVEAVVVKKQESSFDENFTLKKLARRLTLKPVMDWSLSTFATNLESLLPKLTEFNEVYIRYKDERNQTGSLFFDMEEITNQDLNTYLLAQKINISLEDNIGQFSEEIHEELEKKICASVLVEQQRLSATRE